MADWFLIPSPIPTCISVILYVLFVKWIGPKLMESRKPFDLQYQLVGYNAALTLLNLYLVAEVYDIYDYQTARLLSGIILNRRVDYMIVLKHSGIWG